VIVCPGVGDNPQIAYPIDAVICDMIAEGRYMIENSLNVTPVIGTTDV